MGITQPRRHHINYIYFFTFFLSLSFIHTYHILLIDKGGYSNINRSFYIIHTLIQSFLEVFGLVIIEKLLSIKHSKKFQSCFIVMTLIIFLIHVIEFPLIRLMDMTIWFSFDLIFAETWANFVEILLASNIKLSSWILSGVVALIIVIFGFFIYHLMDFLSKKKALYFSYRVAGFSFFSLLFSLLLFDFKLSSVGALKEDSRFLKALPWKTTFFSPPYPAINMGKKLLPKLPEEVYLSELNEANLTIVKKPNIFIFIIESLRDDFLTHKIAPNFAQFREENGSFDCALASANVTHSSWFSIFHSVYPFQWGERQPNKWKEGSLSLNILKRGGYKVNLYSSARLGLYGMNKILFGKENQLIDNCQLFGKELSRPVHERDTLAMQALLKDVKEKQDGNIFLIFLDSTHFGYSCPDQSDSIPTPDTINYFNLACAIDIEEVKNRYCNAVHFIDELFGSFLKNLKATPSGSEAVIVVTGDHGEEFYEQGNIFHASNLSSAQTHVPIYYRLPHLSRRIQDRRLTSHVDIFPTLLDYIFDFPLFNNWFDGESLLTPRKKNFALSTRYNGGRSPFEFLIHNGSEQLIVRLENRRHIFKSCAVHIVSKLDRTGKPTKVNPNEIKQDFKAVWDTLFTLD